MWKQPLTHYGLKTPKKIISTQCRPRSDAAECGIWSVSALFALFANSSTIFLTYLKLKLESSNIYCGRVHLGYNGLSDKTVKNQISLHIDCFANELRVISSGCSLIVLTIGVLRLKKCKNIYEIAYRRLNLAACCVVLPYLPCILGCLDSLPYLS